MKLLRAKAGLMVIMVFLAASVILLLPEPASALTWPEAPTNLSITNANYNTLRLTWTAVSGANGYEIWRRTSFIEPFTKVAAVGTTPSFSNSGLLCDGATTYEYQVAAYQNQVVFGKIIRVLGLWSSTVSAKCRPAKPTSLMVAPDQYDSLKLSWQKETGNDLAEVQQALSAAGPWSTIAKTGTPWLYVKNLTTGTRYYFRIRIGYYYQLRYQVWSEYSGAVSNTPVPATPRISIAYAGYNSLQINWTSVSGATGFMVQRAATSGGPWTTIADTANYYTDTGLITGMMYYYRVCAYRVVGTSRIYGNYSDVLGAAPQPAIPQGVTATSASYNTLQITWKAVLGANGYQIQRSLTSSSYGIWTDLATTGLRSYSDTGLTTGTTYYYRIRAYRIMGKLTRVYGGWGYSNGCTPVPASPVLNINAYSYNSLELQWTTVAGADGYAIQRAPAAAGPWTEIQHSLTGNTFTDSGLTAGASYYYAVRAYRVIDKATQANSAWSNTVSGIPLPVVPTGLTATAANYNTIRLDWTPVIGASGYFAQRSTAAAGPWTVIATSISATTLNDSGLTTGTKYYYRIRAYCLVGTTPVYGYYTETVNAAPLPGAVTGLRATSLSYSSIKLNWTAVSGATGYEVQIGSTAAGPWSDLSLEVGTNAYIDYGLNCGTRYYYRVRAYRLVESARFCGSYTAAVSAIPVPATPAGYRVASAGYTSIQISWSAVAGATGYQIYRATSSGGPYSLLQTITSGAAASFTNTGLTTGMTYYYRIRAYRTVDAATYFGSFTAIRSARPVPATPATFTVVRNSSTSIKVSWSVVSGASGYEVYRAESATGIFSLVKTTTATNFIDNGLTTGNYYFYKVRAYHVEGAVNVYGAFTAIKNAKPY